jgi:hypothetical protein
MVRFGYQVCSWLRPKPDLKILVVRFSDGREISFEFESDEIWPG